VAWLTWASDPAVNALANEEAISAGLRQSTAYADHLHALAGALLNAVPADVPPYLQLNLAVEAIGMQAAVGMNYMQFMFKRCKPPWPTGTDRQAECAQLAELMVKHGDSLMSHMMGTRLGELAGWPAPRVAALLAEQATLPQPLSCAVVQPLLKQIVDAARVGEMAALRAYAQGASAATR
jgi:hypothetical protein